jgi:putative transposase
VSIRGASGANTLFAALVKAWLARRSRRYLRFIRTDSYWVNQIESFFALITEKAMRRGSVSVVVKDLAGKIGHFII